jgi:hypothetical protein
LAEIETVVITSETTTSSYSSSALLVEDQVSSMVKDYSRNSEAVSDEAIARASDYALRLAEGKDIESLHQFIVEVAYLELVRSYTHELSNSEQESLERNIARIDNAPLVSSSTGNDQGSFVVLSKKSKF